MRRPRRLLGTGTVIKEEMIIKNYLMEINGWKYTLEEEPMLYVKETDDACSKNGKLFEVVGLVWLDLTSVEEGYNADGDCWSVAYVRDSNAD